MSTQDIMKLADEYADAHAVSEYEGMGLLYTAKSRVALQSAVDALQAKCEQWKNDAMNGANATFLRGELKKCKAERDALAAKLKELQEQEPVAEFAQDFIFNLRKQPNGERWPVGTKLYTAPKALEPLTDEVACAWCDKSYAEGMLLGWNLNESNSPEDFQKIRSKRLEGARKVMATNRAAHGIGGKV